MEIWKDIKAYEGLYQVSNLGNVKSKERIINRNNNTPMHLKEKYLTPICVNGYLRVSLNKNGKQTNRFIHTLVAETFISNYNNYKEINHKDENTFNNSVDNLEWCTHKYNINYGTGNIRRSLNEKNTKSRKEYTSKKKKAILQYDLKGNFIKEWDSITNASKTLKINKIWEACNGIRNKCGGFVWKYKEVNKLCS